MPSTNLKKLSQERFNALCYSRQPVSQFMSREVEWWSDEEERVVGIVLLDLTDSDWAWIILGRDEKSLFRAIDLDVSIPFQTEASYKLQAKLSEYVQSGSFEFPQHDTDGKKSEILKLRVPEHKLHRNFKILMEGDHHSPARAIIKEISYAFVDVDGNYARDFQTTGFNARLWELFLFVFLYEQKFRIEREYERPDFVADKFGFRIAIEATTVNPTEGEEAPIVNTHAKASELRKDYMPIKFGGPLYTKLRKRYWEEPHLEGIPFIIAIHDFHINDSMTWSGPALEDYLYGVRASWTKDETGHLHVTETPIMEHIWKEKKIPSGFFNQPDAEHVSAVLFSNAATLAKFNRMAKLAGFGRSDIIMYRMGFKQDFDPNATDPIPFRVEISPGEYTERWSEGVRIFHNPNALLPLPDFLFEGCSHHYFENGRRFAVLPDDFIHSSVTHIFVPRDETA